IHATHSPSDQKAWLPSTAALAARVSVTRSRGGRLASHSLRQSGGCASGLEGNASRPVSAKAPSKLMGAVPRVSRIYRARKSLARHRQRSLLRSGVKRSRARRVSVSTRGERLHMLPSAMKRTISTSVSSQALSAMPMTAATTTRPRNPIPCATARALRSGWLSCALSLDFASASSRLRSPPRRCLTHSPGSFAYSTERCSLPVLAISVARGGAAGMFCTPASRPPISNNAPRRAQRGKLTIVKLSGYWLRRDTGEPERVGLRSFSRLETLKSPNCSAGIWPCNLRLGLVQVVYWVVSRYKLNRIERAELACASSLLGGILLLCYHPFTFVHSHQTSRPNWKRACAPKAPLLGAVQTVRNGIKAFNAGGLACLTEGSSRPKSAVPVLDGAKRERLRALLHQ